MVCLIHYNIGIIIPCFFMVMSYLIAVSLNIDPVLQRLQVFANSLFPVRNNICIRCQDQCPELLFSGCKFQNIFFHDPGFSRCGR